MECPLCEREVARFSDHHLLPKSRGGKQQHVVAICNDCHSAIHAFFSNRQLEQELRSVEALRANETFAKHLRWLSRQPPGRRQRTRRPKDRRR